MQVNLIQIIHVATEVCLFEQLWNWGNDGQSLAINIEVLMYNITRPDFEHL